MVLQRRNIVESLTSDELAFLTPVEHHKPNSPRPPSAEARMEVRPRGAPQSSQAQSSGCKPATASCRPEPLRSVTLRLRVATADALRRASMERALEYKQPFTQQAIVEAALAAWLARNGGDSQAASGEGPQGM